MRAAADRAAGLDHHWRCGRGRCRPELVHASAPVRQGTGHHPGHRRQCGFCPQDHRPRRQADRVPTLAIESLTDRSEFIRVLAGFPGYDWAIFTSANGVRIFFEALCELGKDARVFGGMKIAAIGPRSANPSNNSGFGPTLCRRSSQGGNLQAAHRLHGLAGREGAAAAVGDRLRGTGRGPRGGRGRGDQRRGVHRRAAQGR